MSTVVKAVRDRHPTVPLQVDANSAYTLADAETLKRLDEFDLLLIEQPLAHDDIVDHARLQAQLGRRFASTRASTRPRTPARRSTWISCR